MANVSLAIPSIHPLIGIDSFPAVNHQAEFAAAAASPAADRAVLDGAVAMAWTAIDLATEEAVRRRLERDCLPARLSRPSGAGSAVRAVLPEDLAQHVRHLAEGRHALQRLAHRHEQVLCATGGRPHVGERGVDTGLVPRSPKRPQPLDLGLLQDGSIGKTSGSRASSSTNLLTPTTTFSRRRRPWRTRRRPARSRPA